MVGTGQWAGNFFVALFKKALRLCKTKLNAIPSFTCPPTPSTF